jgi:hypothetical protein
MSGDAADLEGAAGRQLAGKRLGGALLRLTGATKKPPSGMPAPRFAGVIAQHTLGLRR